MDERIRRTDSNFFDVVVTRLKVAVDLLDTVEKRTRRSVVILFGIALCLFTVIEMNFPRLQPPSALALFVMMGLVICFLEFPVHPKVKDLLAFRMLNVVLAIAVVVCCGYVVIQLEPAFKSFWPLVGDRVQSLGDRAGAETKVDFIIGLVGLLLVFESTRRTIGWIVPALALLFVAHTYYCFGVGEYHWPEMPDWLLPHRGQEVRDIVSTTFLQTLGVFGPAASVMFKYVFLFVVFGTFLEMSGATQFIIDFSERVFGRSPGGPAKVSVLGSGLMGSLSGSAVANAVTTGTFTIPMMRNAGFQPHIAGGITAAAAAGGALVPPVMGAGAYMMLEFVQPQPTFLEVARAAVIPAVLYYLSIWLIVHFYSMRVGREAVQGERVGRKTLSAFEAMVFFGALIALVGLLAMGKSPFKAVSGSLVVIVGCSIFRRELALGRGPRIMALVTMLAVIVLNQLQSYWSGWLPQGVAGVLSSWEPAAWTDPDSGGIGIGRIFESLLGSSILGTIGVLVFGLCHPAWRPTMSEAMGKAAKNGVALVAASACVGIIIGIVQETGIATDFGAVIKGVVATNLLLALVGIMVCSIIMGMGVPSVVCYLLMATLMGSLLGELGVIPLAAHLFIFYFGMMSMVTPPVALAAYASASIAKAPIMQTALAAFRFSLVGFTLPFMFVYRPALLLMDQGKWNAYLDAKQSGTGNTVELLKVAQGAYAPFGELAIAVGTSVAGVVALAAGIAGFFRHPVGILQRGMFLVAAGMLLYPELWLNIAGGAVLLATVSWNHFGGRKADGPGAAGDPPAES